MSQVLMEFSPEKKILPNMLNESMNHLTVTSNLPYWIKYLKSRLCFYYNLPRKLTYVISAKESDHSSFWCNDENQE